MTPNQKSTRLMPVALAQFVAACFMAAAAATGLMTFAAVGVGLSAGSALVALIVHFWPDTPGPS